MFCCELPVHPARHCPTGQGLIVCILQSAVSKYVPDGLFAFLRAAADAFHLGPDTGVTASRLCQGSPAALCTKRPSAGPAGTSQCTVAA